MRQHLVNLLPAAAQARAEKGAAAGRYVTILIVSAMLAVAVCGHAKFRVNGARTLHDAARKQADQVLETERQQQILEKSLADIEKRVNRYEMVAHPLEISRLAATIVNLLPPSAVLDRLDLEAGARRAVQSARGNQPDPKQKQVRPPRMVTGELAGFAMTDLDVAELVSRLSGRSPFQNVQLEFSRHREVRERSAREFRISFTVNLEARYAVSNAQSPEVSNGL